MRFSELPRKSLTEGDSPRFTIRLNNEIQKILADIDKNKRSAFIREAIIHYASSSTYRSKVSFDQPYKDKVTLPVQEKVQHETPVRVLHKPAWQR